MERRDFLKAAGAAPLATVLANPALAAAAAESLQTIELKTDFEQQVTGFLALPEKTPAPVVLLIHEWWGVNDQIKAVAADFARQGYTALAVDLMKGKVAKTPDEARAQTGAVDPLEALDAMTSWIKHMRGHPASNGKIATVGWCFGGGWSLNSSAAEPVDATVIYYGRVTLPASDLTNLKGPLMGHFGTLDKSINQEMVSGFEKAMEEAGKQDLLTVHWYDADHAFANPTGARYDQGDAELAWKRTLDFLKTNLG